MPLTRMRLSDGLLAILATIPLAAGIAYDLSLQLPSREPEWSQKLSPYLAAFSLEMDRWPDWAGQEVGKPNTFFNQALRNLGERTGHMPYLRIGANSEDRASVDLRFAVMNATFPAPSANVPNPEADHIFIGRDYYALSGNLPEGTVFHWGINMKSLNKSETVAQARLLAEAFQGSRANLTKNVRLDAVEIGNEPDFYGPTRVVGYEGPLGQKWNAANYTRTWVEFAKAITEVIDLGSPCSGKPGLSPGGFTGFNSPEWLPESTLCSGLLDDPKLARKIRQFTEHAYSGGFSPLHVVQPGELVFKPSVRANFTSRTPGRIAVRASGLKYVLAETNSYANHGQPGLSNTVESALWGVDWMLLGASNGVERVHFHHGVGFRYNAIQPTDESDDGLNITRPHVLPLYYAMLIVNEAIGKSGESYIAEIPTSNITLTAYGIWEQKQLRRIVVTNNQVFNGTGEKPSININFTGLVAQGSGKIKKLLSEKTTASTGLTWGGQTFETESGSPHGAAVEEDLKGSSFNLPASSVALVFIDEN